MNVVTIIGLLFIIVSIFASISWWRPPENEKLEDMIDAWKKHYGVFPYLGVHSTPLLIYGVMLLLHSFGLDKQGIYIIGGMVLLLNALFLGVYYYKGRKSRKDNPEESNKLLSRIGGMALVLVLFSVWNYVKVI